MTTDATIAERQSPTRERGGDCVQRLVRGHLSATLYLGDCLEILPQLEAASVDMTVTSPPYNLKKKWWDSGANGCHKDLADKFENEWYDDEIPEPEYQRQQKLLIGECKRISVGCVCYNHKVRHAFKREGRTFHPMDWIESKDLWCEIVWDKGNGTAINCRRPIMADERIYVMGRPTAWNNERLTTVWQVRMERPTDTDHPCAFPIEIPGRLIRMFSEPGVTVLDPYMGSGTTGLACLKSGRNFVGIEKDPEHFATAFARLEREVNQGVLL